ncbi:Tyrosine-protein phosphatase 99A, partial [Fragariocoptes setiger]
MYLVDKTLNSVANIKSYIAHLVLTSNLPFAYSIILIALMIAIKIALTIIVIITIVSTITGYTVYPSMDNTFNASLLAGMICATFALALVIISFILWRKYFQAAYYYLDDPPSATRGNSPQLSETYDDNEYGSIPVIEWSKHVQALHADTDHGFSREYEEIQKATNMNLSCEQSQLPENKHKNRYINIVAYDHTRVILRQQPGQKKPGSDYINANFIDGYNKSKAYIGTQGPLPSTFDDYWRMVWEQRVVIIVMITNLQERGRFKMMKVKLNLILVALEILCSIVLSSAGNFFADSLEGIRSSKFTPSSSLGLQNLFDSKPSGPHIMQHPKSINYEASKSVVTLTNNFASEPIVIGANSNEKENGNGQSFRPHQINEDIKKANTNRKMRRRFRNAFCSDPSNDVVVPTKKRSPKRSSKVDHQAAVSDFMSELLKCHLSKKSNKVITLNDLDINAEELARCTCQQLEAGGRDLSFALSKAINLNELVDMVTGKPVRNLPASKFRDTHQLAGVESLLQQAEKNSNSILRRHVDIDKVSKDILSKSMPLRRPPQSFDDRWAKPSVPKMGDESFMQKFRSTSQRIYRTTETVYPYINVTLEELEKLPGLGAQIQRVHEAARKIREAAQMAQSMEHAIVTQASIEDAAFIVASKHFKWLASLLLGRFLNKKYGIDFTVASMEEVALRVFWLMATKIAQRYTNPNKRKCDQYWPKEGTETYGHIQVKLLQEVVMATYTLRTFTARNLKIKKRGSCERTVYQYHYTNWPDHGVPDHPLPVLSFVRKSASANPPGAGAIICHCSAGCGRSGTYIVIDAMLKQIRHRQSINVVDFLKHIRSQRNYLVQTEEQYIFIHDALVEAIESGETEVASSYLAKYINTLQTGGYLPVAVPLAHSLSHSNGFSALSNGHNGLTMAHQNQQQLTVSLATPNGNPNHNVGIAHDPNLLINNGGSTLVNTTTTTTPSATLSQQQHQQHQLLSSGTATLPAGAAAAMQAMQAVSMSWSLLERQYKQVTNFKAKDFNVVSALKPCNQIKNRSINLVPLEPHRVHITPKPAIEGSDYINATFLMGFNDLHEFIITQHPVHEAFSDFWQMVYDHNSQTIVLLTPMHSGNNTGALNNGTLGSNNKQQQAHEQWPQFWPQKEDEVDYGAFKVKLTQESTLVQDNGGVIITRDFIMRSTQDDYELVCRLVHCAGWPDICGPLSGVFDLIKLVQDLQQDTQHGPIIVVDKYGGTEAATFAVLTTLYKQLMFEDAVDVYMYAKLAHLRRPGIWRSQDDYLFLYRAIENLVSALNLNTDNSNTNQQQQQQQQQHLIAQSASSLGSATLGHHPHQLHPSHQQQHLTLNPHQQIHLNAQQQQPQQLHYANRQSQYPASGTPSTGADDRSPYQSSLHVANNGSSVASLENDDNSDSVCPWDKMDTLVLDFADGRLVSTRGDSFALSSPFLKRFSWRALSVDASSQQISIIMSPNNTLVTKRLADLTKPECDFVSMVQRTNEFYRSHPSINESTQHLGHRAIKIGEGGRSGEGARAEDPRYLILAGTKSGVIAQRKRTLVRIFQHSIITYTNAYEWTYCGPQMPQQWARVIMYDDLVFVIHILAVSVSIKPIDDRSLSAEEQAFIDTLRTKVKITESGVDHNNIPN